MVQAFSAVHSCGSIEASTAAGIMAERDSFPQFILAAPLKLPIILYEYRRHKGFPQFILAAPLKQIFHNISTKIN